MFKLPHRADVEKAVLVIEVRLSHAFGFGYSALRDPHELGALRRLQLSEKPS